MGFSTDKQTLEDLNILGKFRVNSAFSLFNKVITSGGEKLLDSMFRNPLTDFEEINKRCKVFEFFEKRKFVFPFDRDSVGQVEDYIRSEGGSGGFLSYFRTYRRKILSLIGVGHEYKTLGNGVMTTMKLLKSLQDFIKTIPDVVPGDAYFYKLERAKMLLSEDKMQRIITEYGNTRLPFLTIAKFDYWLKYSLYDVIKDIFEYIYELDVLIAVSDVSSVRQFSYAKAYPPTRNFIKIEGLFHPAIENAVPNSLAIYEESNVVFLTGANMAGKSTFMKSFGISIYLAHMGFPVPAQMMEFSVKDGILSSINVSDNLEMGYSHFYAEVLRVKEVAVEVSKSRNLVILFDELFKGTNVKDAYDGTLAITEAFAENRNCSFIISTHIIEVGDMLKERCDNIQFLFLPTVMEGNIPKYTYQLEKGITSDRQGMIIIENEKILEIISGQELMSD